LIHSWTLLIRIKPSAEARCGPEDEGKPYEFGNQRITSRPGHKIGGGESSSYGGKAGKMSESTQPSAEASSISPWRVEHAKALVERGDLRAALVHLSAAAAYAELAAFLYRTKKDVSGMLDCGRAGVEFLLAAAEQKSRAESAVALQLEEKAKSLAFNVAANCWPGWDDEGIELKTEQIQAGLVLAELSQELVKKLRLGDRREGTAHWLVGALHLALGHDDLAAGEFNRAKGAYDAGGQPIESRMVSGYLAIVDEREPAKRDDAVRKLAGIIEALENDDSDAARFFAGQLRTAERVLDRQPAAPG
jgi:hypothetical protein